jgi:oligosaccharyltransferase complex subunit delta (ribophorin II)
MRRSLTSVLITLAAVLLYVATLSTATSLSLEAAKVSVSSIDGSTRVSESFSLQGVSASTLNKAVEVESDEVFRLAFTLRNGAGEKLGADQLPHQLAVVMTDVHEPSRAFTTIVSLKRSTGKASYIQRFDRLPAQLTRGGSGTIRADLLVGSFGGSGFSARVPLLTIQLPASLLQAEQTLSARDRKEIQHGFRRHQDHFHTFAVSAAEQMPPRMLSLLAALITFAVPALVLVGLWSSIIPSLNLRSPSSAISPFLGSLFALELLAYIYWQGLGLTLFKMLPWLVVFTIAAVFTGRNALSELRKIRLGKVQ